LLDAALPLADQVLPALFLREIALAVRLAIPEAARVRALVSAFRVLPRNRAGLLDGVLRATAAAAVGPRDELAAVVDSRGRVHRRAAEFGRRADVRARGGLARPQRDGASAEIISLLAVR